MRLKRVNISDKKNPDSSELQEQYENHQATTSPEGAFKVKNKKYAQGTSESVFGQHKRSEIWQNPKM